MTKKRRHLRILASIIAAGCVWATGMSNAWANEYYVSAAPANYVAIGGALESEKTGVDADGNIYKTIDNHKYLYTAVEDGAT
ncbi:MAG: hypothetical protein IJN33_01165, partial [Phascolarctobacterium sp.]|nr:hypothetical protein [Phascolarctobacterium sp.]